MTAPLATAAPPSPPPPRRARRSTAPWARSRKLLAPRSAASPAVTVAAAATATASPPSRSPARAASPPSSSSTSSSPTAVPRFLRLLRLLFYALAAPNFLYALYVQLVVLKGPGRTPLPASVGFGRDSLFLTFHANVHCTWYACLCLLHAVLLFPSALRRPRSRAGRAVERACHRFTPVVFPLAAFVGLAYYLILHFHPLNRLRAQLVPDHDSKMALLHLNPLLFVLGDSWLKDADLFVRHAFKPRRAMRLICAYGTAYFAWTVVCTRFNGGHWPYPFQMAFSVVQHVMFVLGSLLSSTYLTRTGFRLHAKLDRRRRRRLAAGNGTGTAQHAARAAAASERVAVSC